MRNIAKINENDRKALFHNTAAKMGMTDAIIGKDFWVCYMLDYLFHRCAWKDNIAFKRGTMRLMPPEYNLDKIRDDYEHMQNMLFGNKPSFDEIMEDIAKLEKEINAINIDIK